MSKWVDVVGNWNSHMKEGYTNMECWKARKNPLGGYQNWRYWCKLMILENIYMKASVHISIRAHVYRYACLYTGLQAHAYMCICILVLFTEKGQRARARVATSKPRTQTLVPLKETKASKRNS